MRLFSLLIALLLLPTSWLAAAELLRSPMPGSATPQPYAQPQVRPLGRSISNPPLLNNPSRPRPLSVPQPLPKDQPLPQLQEQPERRPPSSTEKLQRLERAE
ncbi:hypothetical protein A9179_07890 [Pseudomonas alcaligenes]|uniref:Uncharacterized protein n=1 Tax=Aquipseudomonas alcaligenes TaxID=43263 RepID=A0ABR7RYC3_AQUAC|nr:hypothetical protein [Pseudomonas alcaligenes]MBC9250193.1 hypothetical protein [Pseudomonas alcaligenes]